MCVCVCLWFVVFNYLDEGAAPLKRESQKELFPQSLNVVPSAPIGNHRLSSVTVPLSRPCNHTHTPQIHTHISTYHTNKSQVYQIKSILLSLSSSPAPPPLLFLSPSSFRIHWALQVRKNHRLFFSAGCLNLLPVQQRPSNFIHTYSHTHPHTHKHR